MSSLVLVNLDSLDDAIEVQFDPTGVATVYETEMTSTPGRGGLPPLVGASHQKIRGWMLGLQLIQDDADDDLESRIDKIAALQEWDPTKGRPPRVQITGLGRRSYDGTVSRVAATWGRLDGSGNPRSAELQLTFLIDSVEATQLGEFLSIGIAT